MTMTNSRNKPIKSMINVIGDGIAAWFPEGVKHKAER